MRTQIFSLFINNFSATSRAFPPTFHFCLHFSRRKSACFCRSNFSLSLVIAKQFPHFQVNDVSREEKRNLCTENFFFSPQMQTFSIFLSSGTDEKENVKRILFSSRCFFDEKVGFKTKQMVEK
jgi:hypothetical protein